MMSVSEEEIERLAYVEAIKGIRFSPKETAAIVVDMQNDFIHKEGKFAPYGLHESGMPIVPRIARLLERVRAIRVPVVYTKTVYGRGMIDAPLWALAGRLGALEEGSWGAEIVEELKPTEGDYVVEKKRYSAFYGTSMEILLRALKVRTLLLSGVATNVCVESTARDAHFRDFHVAVLSDCTATFTKELHNASLRAINHYFGVVLTSEEAMERLRALA